MSIKKILKKITPNFVLSAYHYALAFLGAVMYRFPSQELIVIGVTGTSGKSTTVDFITRILTESGAKVASISSVRFSIGDKEWKNELKMTTPGRFKIQKFLRQAVTEKCKYAVLEIASEGIKQHRHKFIQFNTAVFTNLTPEHIESHGGFENYKKEKLKLFAATPGTHVINVDDKNAAYFTAIPSKEKYFFGITASEEKVLVAKNIIAKPEGISFTVKETEFNLQVLGEFNAYNALAAITIAVSEGIALNVCKKALEKAGHIPGRMEIVSRDPLVVVDYAHTPEQLEAAYKSLGSNPLVCVLGSCGGGRDKWKRPVLGKIAGEYCREVIVTNEDPYDEDPWDIISEVADGIENKDKEHHLVLDRKEAIKKALDMAKPSETVIITGKGSEPLMCLANGKKIPWSDKEVVNSLVSSKKG